MSSTTSRASYFAIPFFCVSEGFELKAIEKRLEDLSSVKDEEAEGR
jgi:hypothetical protein